MTDVARLVESFRSAATGDAKVELVLELEDHVGDPRVLELFASVIADPAEYDLARIECLKILRLWPPGTADQRRVLGRAIATVLSDDDDDLLVRQYAAGALGPFADDQVVFDAVAHAVSQDSDIDVRHNALTSVEEAGADDRAVELLSRLAGDPDLGSAAQRTLRTWSAAG